MKHPLLRSLAALAMLALGACARGGVTSALPPTTQLPQALTSDSTFTLAGGPGTFREVCGGASRLPGHDHCEMVIRTDAAARVDIAPATFAAAGAHPNGVSCEMKPGCYGPSALQSAYGVTALAKSRGKGVTIAVIDAYGYPGVQADLNQYRSAFGLPACKAGCFKVVNQNGKTSPLPKPNTNPNDDWRFEEALDIDMVSALCPNCHILLVQANSDYGSNLSTSAVTAARLGASVISNSYAGEEVVRSDSAYGAAHVVYTASSGDNGAGPGQPCSLATVVCVGGTSLKPSKQKRGWSEVVWDDLKILQCGASGKESCGATGSGCSAVVPKPSWQNDKGCMMRSETDVSADADPVTGVVIACIPCGGSKTQVLAGAGGTSASAPMMAALIALAGNARTVAQPQGIWSHRGKGFNDITFGTNELAAAGTFICPKSYAYICNARRGYDGPSGWGTPSGVAGL